MESTIVESVLESFTKERRKTTDWHEAGIRKVHLQHIFQPASLHGVARTEVCNHEKEFSDKIKINRNNIFTKKEVNKIS